MQTANANQHDDTQCSIHSWKLLTPFLKISQADQGQGLDVKAPGGLYKLSNLTAEQAEQALHAITPTCWML